MGKFYQCVQSYGPSFMIKFCSALLCLENLLTNIFAKLNLRGGVSCMPAGLLFELPCRGGSNVYNVLSEKKNTLNSTENAHFFNLQKICILHKCVFLLKFEHRQNYSKSLGRKLS